jgi:hypothetical protein
VRKIQTIDDPLYGKRCSECGVDVEHQTHTNDCSYWQQEPHHDPQAEAAIRALNAQWSHEMQQLVRPGIKPGIFQRVTWWTLRHLGLAFTFSLVGWLLFLAWLALMLLPGCSDAGGVEQRERASFTAAERLVIQEAYELGKGAITPEHFVKDMHEVMEALREGEAGERQNAPGWFDVIGAALGSSTVVGGAVHLLRNRTRRRDLDDATEKLRARLAELESKRGAS